MAAEPLVIGPDQMMVLKTTSTPVVYTGDPNGMPFHIAAINDHDFVGVVQMLVEKGADVNLGDGTSRKSTALNNAAALANVKICEFLLNHGADVSLVDTRGFNALHGAVYVREEGDASTAKIRRRLDVIDLLLSHGIDVNYRTKVNATPLMYAVSGFGSLEIVDRLLKAGADVDIGNVLNRTCLHECLSSYSETKTDIMTKLIVNGASIFDKDLLGANAIDYILNRRKLNEAQKAVQMKELIKIGCLVGDYERISFCVSNIEIDGIKDFYLNCFSEYFRMTRTNLMNGSTLCNFALGGEEAPSEILEEVYEKLMTENFAIYEKNLIAHFSKEYFLDKLCRYRFSANSNIVDIILTADSIRHLCRFLSKQEVFSILKAPLSD